MALSNYNNGHSVSIHVSSLTADIDVPALHCFKDVVLESVVLINGEDIPADNSNFIEVEIKNGSTVIAKLDSRASAQGGIQSMVAKSFQILEPLNDVSKGATLTINYDETGTIGLTSAVVSLWVRTK
jgi:hypothetical protein